MAPTQKYDYDFFVIGGGSGGLGAARRAAQYGAKVGLVEGSPRLGGTCVNVGCVPKKVMWHAADVIEKVRAAPAYGFTLDPATVKTGWPTLKKKRDEYIKRLNGIYEKNLKNDNVEYLTGHTRFVGPHELEIDQPEGGKKKITAERICIAVGGRPTLPEIEGVELGTSSDGFFELEDLPKRVAVVGAGYIAVELAGVLHTLGAETHLLIRHDNFLRTFDPIIQKTLIDYMERTGIKIHRQTNVKKVTTTSSERDTRKPFPKTIHTDKGDPFEVDYLLWAIGRQPETDKLGMDKVPQIKLNKKGQVEVNEYQETALEHVSAIGDVTGQLELTPVAIAAGRRYSNRIFGGKKDDKLSYEFVPSVVFSHPTCGSIGLTEPQAREKYGNDIKIYTSNFTAMYFSMMDADHKEPTAYKLICTGPEEKVVGMHIIGMGSDEITQGFSVAIKMGATKKDFDDTVAIHPTSSEELVTMP